MPPLFLQVLALIIRDDQFSWLLNTSFCDNGVGRSGCFAASLKHVMIWDALDIFLLDSPGIGKNLKRQAEIQFIQLSASIRATFGV